MSDQSIRFSLHSGISIQIDDVCQWNIFQEIFVERQYETATKKALQLCPYSSVSVLDLGCNCGIFSLFLADQMLKSNLQDFQVIGIDGSMHVLRQYQNKVSAKGDLWIGDKFTPIFGLVGKKEGKDKFQCYTDVNTAMSQVSETGNTEVTYIDLDKVAPNGCTLIKCDIEGSEMDFIESYPDLLKKTNVAVFEFHHRLVDVDKCVNFMYQYGFRREEKTVRGNLSIETFANAN